MIDYDRAVDEVCHRLTQEYRAALRASLSLPAWFYPTGGRRVILTRESARLVVTLPGGVRRRGGPKLFGTIC